MYFGCFLRRNIFDKNINGLLFSDISQRNATVFHDALNDGLHVLGNDYIVLKGKQYEAVAVHEKDCLVVLPVGFGKSFIYQLLSIPLSDTILLLE